VIHKPKISKKANTGGRGAGSNPHNRFLAARYESTDDAVMFWQHEDFDEQQKRRTSFIEVHPKSILSENNSPDICFI
jgi:hypothetical protein